MSNSKISQALQALFEKHRIVFWYDAKDEFKADFEQLQLHGVEKIQLNNNEFGVKHRLLRQEPDHKFLLYAAYPQPDDLENWLLDIQLAQGEFRTDQVALWLAELELGLGFADVIKAHSEFFQASKRKDSLKRLLVADDTLTVLDKSAAEDNDSIVVTAETASSKNLKTIEDLKAVAGDLALAAPPEFKERPQGIPGLESTYGVVFGSFRPLTGQGIVQALKNGQVGAANIFSTDPAIAANGFVALEDTKRLFGSQNIVPLVRADRAEEVKDTLNAVSAKLTTESIAGMLKQTDIDKADPKTVAEEFLKTNGLG